MKPILPSLRQKKRYLAFEIFANTKIKNVKSVSEAVHKGVSDFIGQLGIAEAGIKFVQFDTKSQRGIIKVSNKYLNQLKSALIMIERIGRKKVIFKSVGVSGIMKKVQNKYIYGGI